MNIPNPAPLPDKMVPAADVPAIGPSAPAVQTRTWRCVELVFESEKEYADPFSDVTLDLLLTG